jgi:acetyl esterase
MSRPLVADTLARLVTAFVNPTPKPSVRFLEIAGRINEVTIQTRHGPAAATIYHPEATDTKPGVYVNVHGGGFVGGRREMDDSRCRYLAAHADVVVVNTDYVLARTSAFPHPSSRSTTFCNGRRRPNGIGTAAGCAWAARAQGATFRPPSLGWH